MAISDVQANSVYNAAGSQTQNTKQAIDSSSTNESKDNGAMGKDDFLKLLVTSLMYQDPMSPMETGDMMQQMAMLGLMEQTTNMRTALDQLAKSNELSKWQEGSNMLGKTVSAVNTQGEEVTGVVKELFSYDGSLYFMTDKDTFEVGDVLSLKNTTSTDGDNTASTDKEMLNKAIQQIEESKTTKNNQETTSATTIPSNNQSSETNASVNSTSPSSVTPSTSATNLPQISNESTAERTTQDEYTIGDLNQLLG